jgi:hypothetical protein
LLAAKKSENARAYAALRGFGVEAIFGHGRWATSRLGMA